MDREDDGSSGRDVEAKGLGCEGGVDGGMIRYVAERRRRWLLVAQRIRRPPMDLNRLCFGSQPSTTLIWQLPVR